MDGCWFCGFRVGSGFQLGWCRVLSARVRIDGPNCLGRGSGALWGDQTMGGGGGTRDTLPYVDIYTYDLPMGLT